MIQNIIDKNPDIQENYDAIIKLKQDKMEIKSPDFTPRKLTPDFLSTIEWNRITKGYNPEEIKRTIHYIAKDEVEKEMMAEAILAAAKKTEEEFYNPSPDVYEDVECEQKEFDDYEPDYSEAYQLCNDIIKAEGKVSLLVESESGNANLTDINYFIPKRKLQDLLKGSWFDTYSTDREKYTVEWREKLVEDLMASQYGTDIAKTWKNRKNIIQCSLVGALKDVEVLEGKIKDLAASVDNNIKDVQIKNVAEYIGNKGSKPYLPWLENYVSSNNSEPYSD